MGCGPAYQRVVHQCGVRGWVYPSAEMRGTAGLLGLVGNFISFDGGWYMIRFLAVLILENDKLLLDCDWYANGFLDMFPLENKALTLDPVVNLSPIDSLWKQAGPLLLKLVPPQSGRGLDVADEGIGDIVCCSILNAVKSDQTFSQAAARRLN